MTLTKDEMEKLDETHEAVLQLRTVILGANGDDGLVGQQRRDRAEILEGVRDNRANILRLWVTIPILILGMIGLAIQVLR